MQFRLFYWLKRMDLLSFRYIFFTGFVFVLLFSVAVYQLLPNNSEWIGYWGSIVGGVFTLWGVVISIRWNEKLRGMERLPQKLLHVENTRDLVTHAINELELLTAYPDQVTFFQLDQNRHHETELFRKYQQELPSNIRSQLLQAGADSYQKYLAFHRQLDFAQKRTLFKARDSWMRASLGSLTDKHLEAAQNLLTELHSFYDEMDTEYAKAIREAYQSLSKQLAVHHEQLLQKIHEYETMQMEL
ncbi:hypothetical protein GCM10011571_33920 [Marinithermofilum abyssi]|uniref:Uncharacterized protein n=1 Tax=Marinithermofilum abyssi TaxID=1571185 RepID=A0A8J2VLY5_9BACL|nr:hypothetical protein [Marinithermofilum abyssi]GGE28991.1 hypothetical protein GCM10011571_33920 [Marinithermofilum abyssi]